MTASLVIGFVLLALVSIIARAAAVMVLAGMLHDLEPDVPALGFYAGLLVVVIADLLVPKLNIAVER